MSSRAQAQGRWRPGFHVDRSERRAHRGWRRGRRAVALAIGLCILAIGGAFGDEYQGVGIVLSLRPAERTVILDHEAIAGLMPPMKMGFLVASPDLLVDLKPGDRVRFTLKAKGEELQITQMTKIED